MTNTTRLKELGASNADVQIAIDEFAQSIGLKPDAVGQMTIDDLEKKKNEVKVRLEKILQPHSDVDAEANRQAEIGDINVFTAAIQKLLDKVTPTPAPADKKPEPKPTIVQRLKNWFRWDMTLFKELPWSDKETDVLNLAVEATKAKDIGDFLDRKKIVQEEFFQSKDKTVIRIRGSLVKSFETITQNVSHYNLWIGNTKMLEQLRLEITRFLELRQTYECMESGGESCDLFADLDADTPAESTPPTPAAPAAAVDAGQKPVMDQSAGKTPLVPDADGKKPDTPKGKGFLRTMWRNLVQLKDVFKFYRWRMPGKEAPKQPLEFAKIYNQIWPFMQGYVDQKTVPQADAVKAKLQTTFGPEFLSQADADAIVQLILQACILNMNLQASADKTAAEKEILALMTKAADIGEKCCNEWNVKLPPPEPKKTLVQRIKSLLFKQYDEKRIADYEKEIDGMPLEKAIEHIDEKYKTLRATLIHPEDAELGKQYDAALFVLRKLKRNQNEKKTEEPPKNTEPGRFDEFADEMNKTVTKTIIAGAGAGALVYTSLAVPVILKSGLSTVVNLLPGTVIGAVAGAAIGGIAAKITGNSVAKGVAMGTAIGGGLGTAADIVILLTSTGSLPVAVVVGSAAGLASAGYLLYKTGAKVIGWLRGAKEVTKE